ncbi:MAG: hypothetical protein J7K40_04210 [candidate division Zixibacteria bacterium]|nr:hypothetical protein [candidate division Zixibacteria bacterium]
MPDAFNEFLVNHPIWGLLIIALMALPIVGAIFWVISNILKKSNNNPQ